MYAGGAQTVYEWGAIAVQKSHVDEQTVDRRSGKTNGSAEEGPILDRYFPAGGSPLGIRMDDVNAIRSGSKPANQHNCYCGNCSLCRTKRSDASASEKSSHEMPDEKLKTDADAESLSEDEKREVTELVQRDTEVRAHEQAHAAAGAGNPTYTYQAGPDGRQYAIGGSTDMRVSSPSGNADAKLEQARRLRSAALAPTDPSPQDYAVAAKADQILAEARQEKAEEKADRIDEDDGKSALSADRHSAETERQPDDTSPRTPGTPE